jgi:hypothetical protein
MRTDEYWQELIEGPEQWPRCAELLRDFARKLEEERDKAIADKQHYIDSLAKNKRPFSTKLTDEVIANQVKEINRLTALVNDNGPKTQTSLT